MSFFSRLFCRRRAVATPRAAANNEVQEENEGWELVNHAPRRLNTRLRAAVRKVVRLLFYRRKWARVSSALNTVAVQRNPRLQLLLRRVRADLMRKITRTAHMFSHLQRIRGRLQYR